MGQPNWDIREEGRTWRKDEAWQRLELLPQKFEMIQGQLLLSDEECENLLGALLEMVGATRAVQLGSPDVWRAAIAGLPE
jgi:hypothetical protein